MSTEIKQFSDTFNTILTQFYGGDKLGVSLQITQDTGYVQFNIPELFQVCMESLKWIQQINKERAESLQKKIEEMQILKKTIFQDAVDCEHFISDIKIMEMPISLLHMTRTK